MTLSKISLLIPKYFKSSRKRKRRIKQIKGRKIKVLGDTGNTVHKDPGNQFVICTNKKQSKQKMSFIPDIPKTGPLQDTVSRLLID